MNLRFFALLSAILSPALTHAGSADTGQFRTLHFMANGTVVAYTTGARADVPACASSQPSRFVFDASTDQGKAQLSGLLTAYATNKSVKIFGTGACNVIGDTETLSYFYFID